MELKDLKTKESLVKLWDISIQNMSRDVEHDARNDLSLQYYNIQLPSFLEEPIPSYIQLMKSANEKPKLCIIIGYYIEYASAEITDEEFSSMSEQFIDKINIIELEIRNNLIKKAEKNLEILIENI